MTSTGFGVKEVQDFLTKVKGENSNIRSTDLITKGVEFIQKNASGLDGRTKKDLLLEAIALVMKEDPKALDQGLVGDIVDTVISLAKGKVDLTLFKKNKKEILGFAKACFGGCLGKKPSA